MVFPSVTLSNQTHIPDIHLQRGEVIQLIVPDDIQEELVDLWLFPSEKKKRLQGLGQDIGFVLNGRGILANLTIKENIMLPILYHRSEVVVKALNRIDALLDETQLKPLLEERAGLRSARVNNNVSLCRCALQQASYIVMQQPQSSMSKKEARQFTKLALQIASDLHAGVVYLTASEDDCGGLAANYQINISQQESPL